VTHQFSQVDFFFVLSSLKRLLRCYSRNKRLRYDEIVLFYFILQVSTFISRLPFICFKFQIDYIFFSISLFLFNNSTSKNIFSFVFMIYYLIRLFNRFNCIKLILQHHFFLQFDYLLWSLGMTKSGKENKELKEQESLFASKSIALIHLKLKPQTSLNKSSF
jgi:hypothetical protein